MGVPFLVDELSFDDDISLVEVSSDGSFIAVAVAGLLGVYRVYSKAGVRKLVHLTSYILPDDIRVTSAYFSSKLDKLTIITDDACRKELSLVCIEDGLMMQLSSSNCAFAA